MLVHDAGKNVEIPTPTERTIGDLLDPMRPGEVMSVINLVTKATNQDAMGWSWNRLASMLTVLEVSAAQLGE